MISKKEKIVLEKINGSPKELLTLRLMTAIQNNEFNAIQLLITENKVDYFDELKEFIKEYPIASEVIKMFEQRELNKLLNKDLPTNNNSKNKIKI